MLSDKTKWTDVALKNTLDAMCTRGGAVARVLLRRLRGKRVKAQEGIADGFEGALVTRHIGSKERADSLRLPLMSSVRRQKDP